MASCAVKAIMPMSSTRSALTMIEAHSARLSAMSAARGITSATAAATSGAYYTESSRTMGRKPNTDREEALLTDSLYYNGQKCWCGSAVRYVSTGACVECAKKNTALNRQRQFAAARAARAPEETKPWD